MDSESLAVIGLGRMGLPIAEHLAAAGHDLVAFDRDPERTRLAAAQGLRVVSSVRDATVAASVVITVLPGAPAFDDVMLGPAGVLDSFDPGCCWLDLTSNDPRVARRVAERSAARGVRAVGAPMGGGVDAASRAELEFFVGGAPEARARTMSILQTLARADGIRITGDDIESGYATKLLINLLWFGQVAAVSEALLLGERMGVPAEALRGFIAGSAGDSAFAQRHLDRLLDGDYLETFGLSECADELDILSDLAREREVPFELSHLVTSLHHEALTAFGPVDGELMVAKLLEQRAGMKLRRSR